MPLSVTFNFFPITFPVCSGMPLSLSKSFLGTKALLPVLLILHLCYWSWKVACTSSLCKRHQLWQEEVFVPERPKGKAISLPLSYCWSSEQLHSPVILCGIWNHGKESRSFLPVLVTASRLLSCLCTCTQHFLKESCCVSCPSKRSIKFVSVICPASSLELERWERGFGQRLISPSIKSCCQTGFGGAIKQSATQARTVHLLEQTSCLG